MTATPMADREDRPDTLPLAEWQLWVEAAGDKLTGRIRHCAHSAFDHLRRAWTLHGVDDPMSAFRAITAEEEAATALILALQRRRYPGADKLSPWNHVHKSSFWPLIAAISDMMHRSGMPAPQVMLSKTSKPHVVIRIDLNAMAGLTGDPVFAEPEPPLNFTMRAGQASATMVHMFEEELAALASIAGEKSIHTYVKREANLRNKLLYASDTGIPSVSFADAMIVERARRACVLLVLTVIVLQAPECQLFVLQCLEGLLRALKMIGDTAFSYEGADPPRDRRQLKIERIVGQPTRIAMTRPTNVRISFGSTPRPLAWPEPVTVRVNYDLSGAQRRKRTVADHG